MEVKKLFNIVKEDSKGQIQFEKYDNGLETYAVNTQSIGISFKTLEGAIQYIEKYNYKISYDKVTPQGYNFKDVKINVMECLGDFEENFKTIYTLLLDYTLNKGFLENWNTEYIELVGVYNKAIELLNEELNRQYITYEKANKKFLNDDVYFELQEMSYSINEEYFKKYPHSIRLIDNSITGILLRIA